MPLIDNIYLAAIIQGCFLIIVLLLNRRGIQSVNRMLAVLIGLLVWSLWNLYTYKIEIPGYWRLIDYNGWYSTFFWGPTLYFYVGMTTDQFAITPSRFLRHSLIGLLFFTLGTSLALFNTTGSVLPSVVETFNDIQLLMFYIQISIYLFASYQLLKKYDLTIRNHFSAMNSMSLLWLQRLVFIFAGLILIDMCITVPHVIRDSDEIPFFEFYLLAEAVAIFSIAYFSFTHSDLLFRNQKIKYESSPLDKELSANLAQKLTSIMEETKPHTNNDLKLQDLADLVDVNPHYLSQVINEQLGKNFYDFVNGYRAQLAAELLLKEDSNNITQIAYDSGFNNRVSFNNTFKKHTQMTPSQYRRNQGKHQAAPK